MKNSPEYLPNRNLFGDNNSIMRLTTIDEFVVDSRKVLHIVRKKDGMKGTGKPELFVIVKFEVAAFLRRPRFEPSTS